jgi:hypothetical protein
VAVTLSEAAANAACAAVTGALNGGWLNVYEGVRPLRADAPVTTQRLLVALRLGTPAFGPPVRGIAHATLLKPATALQDGAASWYRMLHADGTPSHDGSAGIMPGNDLVLTTDQIVTGAIVGLTLCVYRQRMV